MLFASLASSVRRLEHEGVQAGESNSGMNLILSYLPNHAQWFEVVIFDDICTGLEKYTGSIRTPTKYKT